MIEGSAPLQEVHERELLAPVDRAAPVLARLSSPRPTHRQRPRQERLDDDGRDVALPADSRSIAKHVGDRLRGLPDDRARSHPCH